MVRAGVPSPPNPLSHCFAGRGGESNKGIDSDDFSSSPLPRWSTAEACGRGAGGEGNPHSSYNLQPTHYKLPTNPSSLIPNPFPNASLR